MCDESQTHVLMPLGAYVLVCHLASLDRVEGTSGIFQRDEDTVIVDVDVYVECLLNDASFRVLGDIGH